MARPERERVAAQRAYTRALADLKDTFPGQFKIYFEVRQAEALKEFDDFGGQPVFKLGVRQTHTPDEHEANCVGCGKAWPCYPARRRLGLTKTNNAAHIPKHLQKGDKCSKCGRNWPCKAARRRLGLQTPKQ